MRRSCIIVREMVADGQAVFRFPLPREACDFVHCDDGPSFLEAVSRRRPDLAIYGLDPACESDFHMLQLMRRIAPTVPLVILARGGSLLLQQRVRPLNPMFYAVCPVDRAELEEVIHAALSRRTGTQ